MLFDPLYKCYIWLSWHKRKTLSFEPDLNQRPKDDYDGLPLQSSALPTELSKVHIVEKEQLDKVGQYRSDVLKWN